MPGKLQQRVNRFGLDPDEFPNTGHCPHSIYVREGRRMLSDYVMTQDNCESKRVAEESIGLASYNMDSHPCQRVAIDGQVAIQDVDYQKLSAKLLELGQILTCPNTPADHRHRQL